ncbi:MAG: alpha/beta hydrolase [Nanoarchaeota archaeon]
MNCIIVHGCPSDNKSLSYNKHWMPWAQKELMKRNIKTVVPVMPSPWNPDYKKFKDAFEKYAVNEGTVLIGHSCGCAFLVRWLGETKKSIAKLILVAPWKINDRGDKYREAFYTFTIDSTIKDCAKSIVMFTSDDEEPAGKASLRIYHTALEGKIVNLKKHGHYTMKSMGTEIFPELLEEILRK